GPQALDALDVLERPLGRKRLLVAGRKCAAVLGPKLLRAHSPRGNGIKEAILPGAHDILDVGFQLGDVDVWGDTRVAADDKLHAHQRALGGKVGIIGCQATAVGLTKKRADALAHPTIEAIARNIDEGRDEAVEAVNAHKCAYPRTHLQVEDAAAN